MCPRCKVSLPVDAFNRNRSKKDGLESHCKKCKKAYMRKWYAENREEWKAYQRKRHAENPERKKAYYRNYIASFRQQVYHYFGNKCNVCGTTEPPFDLDHVNGDGKQHREELELGRSGGVSFYRKLVLDDFKTDYELQLLCKSCHRAKTAAENHPLRAASFSEIPFVANSGSR